MATYTFLGECPASMKPVFIESYGPQPIQPVVISVNATDFGSGSTVTINSALRKDPSKTIIIDWGDNSTDTIDGDVTNISHNYNSSFLGNINITNIKYLSLRGDNSYYSNSYTIRGLVLNNDIEKIECRYLGIPPGQGEAGLYYVTMPSDSTLSIVSMYECRKVHQISIPSAVTIGTVPTDNTVFAHCYTLTSVTFDGRTISQVQSMPNYPFGLTIGSLVGDLEDRVTVTCTDGSFILTRSCILKGTNILLADGTTKKIEDLTYDDVLKVWDFDKGQLGSAKVCWLTRPGLKSNHYYQLTFDNGTILKTTGINSNHRIFSVDRSKFTNVCDAKVGDKVFSIDGTLTITDVKYVEEECEYCNVMTSDKINCFANGILTSDRYGNLYPIQNMKYVKDDREIKPYSLYEAVGIDRYWYDNLRLGENDETVEKSKEYVWKCIGQMLPLPAQS